MLIEIWSDFACPYCYIGKRNLEEALKDFPNLIDVDISYKSFELDPNASNEATLNTKDRLMKKYDLNDIKAQEMIDSITSYAKKVGLDIHFDTAHYTNTFNAHKLSKYAKNKNKEKEVVEKLFHSYLIKNERLSDFNTLTNIANELGFDKSEIKKILNSNEFEDKIRLDQKEAQSFGINSVPYFVINRKYAISGAQNIDIFKKAIKKGLDESSL